MPRWLIAVLDASILWKAAIIAYIIRFNFELDVILSHHIFLGSTFYMLVGLSVMMFTKSYKGIVRHTGFKDSTILFKTISISFILLTILNLSLGRMHSYPFFIPTSILVIASLNSLFMLMFYRLMVKELFSYLRNSVTHSTTKKGVIFGAGEAGIIAQDVIKRDSNTLISIVAFLDDAPQKDGKILDGKRIYRGLDMLQHLVETQKIEELIIAVRDLPMQRKREIIDECLRLNIHVSIIPPVDQWINGNLEIGAIREVKIEDLLSREEICINNPKVEEDLKGKVVLVTGAAGSIGSELCRQIIHYQPALLVMLDQAESPLYDIEQELKESGLTTPIRVILADVRNKTKIRQVFKTYKPEVVFHAAAYKHVPMMENYPEESLKTNVLGTKCLADMAVLHNVEKFVFVSTDKAVNPTNVMGATKRAAEMYVQSLNAFLDTHHKRFHTKFITTRFGNVLGSNGSVIPLFKKQIMKGGPIRVTHPDITRYFMTIPEACQLVLEAGVMGEGGEIFVFDMGQPVKIVDLAKKMIQLSGKKLDEDIKIVFSGLREGEKLYEELLNDSEVVKITHHPKIKIAEVFPVDYYKLDGQLGMFKQLFERNVDNELVSHLKTIVPEFKSNASRFEVLDRLN